MRLIGLIVLVGLFSGCGGRSEADDPHDILGEDLQHNGVDARDTPGGGGHTADRPATRAECQAASARLADLGIQLAIDGEADAAKRRQLQQEKASLLSSPETKQRIDQGTDDCLQREVTSNEARCISRVKSEADIDRCVSGP